MIVSMNFKEGWNKHIITFENIISSMQKEILNLQKKKVIWKPINGEEQDFDYTSKGDDKYKKQLKQFIECIENGAKPHVSIMDGIKTLKYRCVKRYVLKNDRSMSQMQKKSRMDLDLGTQ